MISLCKTFSPISSSYIKKSFINNNWLFGLETDVYCSCIRSMAYITNKRITRLLSDIEVDESELQQNGNEQYVNVRLKNRNPRNLEQMLMEPKPMGFEMNQPNRHYWNKIVFEKKSNYLIGKIVHHSGRTVIEISTNEPSLRLFLGTSKSDGKAAMILGQVMAMRALESGIHSVFCDYQDYNIQKGGKMRFFIDSLSQNGLNLNEQPVIVARAQRDH